MAAVTESLGLCSTCNNAPGCYYLARRGPALFCELFDGYAPPAERSAGARAAWPAAASPARRAVEEEAAQFSGLCVNCEHRRTCTSPKPEGGVWHCENYE
jgi:hypothetical protein